MSRTDTVFVGKWMDSLLEINGKKYLTVNDFARLSGKTVNTIHILCTKGNTFRQLTSVKLGNNRYVEADELFAFPFVARGRYGPLHPKRINEDGEYVTVTDGVA